MQIDESRTRRLLAGCNERLSGKSTSWVEFSVLYRIYRAVFTCGRGSRIFGWLFSGGMTAVLLFAIGLYVLIDYVLRDVMAIPVVSSVWDEALLLLCIVWLIWERKKAPSAISPKLNPLDFPVGNFPHGLLRAFVRRLPVSFHSDCGLPRNVPVPSVVLSRHAADPATTATA